MSYLTVLSKQHPQTWTAEQLIKLTSDELGALCLLMGIAHSGTKPIKIERLLVAAAVRTTLAGYGANAEDKHDVQIKEIQRLASDYKGRELRTMCKNIGVYAGRTKYALAAALINWRNGCRQKGKQAKKEAAQANAQRPQQLKLRLEDNETP